MHIDDTDVTTEDDAETLRIENIFGAVGLALVDKMQKAFDEASGLNPSEAEPSSRSVRILASPSSN